MHFLKICTVAFVIANALNASAQSKVGIVKVGGNLLSVLREGADETTDNYGGFSVAVEYELTNKTTLVVGGHFNTKETSLSVGSLSYRLRQTILTVEPEFRWYPKAATKGFYLGLAPVLYQLKAVLIGVGNGTEKDTQVGISLKTGYQLALTQQLTLQLGAGAGAILPNNNADLAAQLNLNVLLGYQF